jgi:hypothetical protein
MTPTRMIDGPSTVQGMRAQTMRGGIAFSVGVHVLILILMIFGLPFFHSKPRDLPPMISVELVQMGTESKPTPPQPTPPEPQPRPEMPSTPKLSSVTPDVETLKVPNVDVRAQIPDAPKLTNIEPKLEELQQPKVDLKKPAPKENINSVLDKLTKQVPPKPPAENFDSVLKNLTKQVPQKPTDQQPEAQAKTPPRPATGANAPIAANLTASEMDALSQQLRQCWSLPATAKDAQDLIVDVDITVNPDRTLSAAPRVVDQGRMAADPAFRAAAMAAVRAFRMPQCSPLALPPDKYQEWQNMTVHFDPKEMLGQ